MSNLRQLHILRPASSSQTMGLMSIPQQHLGDRAYNVGNFFDYGNDYQRAFVDPDAAAQECFVYENQLNPPSLLHNNFSFGPG